jgi:hypothetical protein
LEDERHKLIEKAMKVIPNYHPPQDYRRPTKTQEKVYVPVNDYPEINFSMIANPQFLTCLIYLFCHFSFSKAMRTAFVEDAHCFAWKPLPNLIAHHCIALPFDLQRLTRSYSLY